MQIITLRCPACGATLKIQNSETNIICEYCQNPIVIIKPLTPNGLVEGLTEIEQNKYQNYLSILEQSMLAGNYREGYDYCNKGLEINPNSAELWANKAVCSLWISTVEQVSEEKAMEIITYLNACQRHDPELKIYSQTAKSIASNLYYCVLYKYSIMQPDQYVQNGGRIYSVSSKKEMLSCLKVLELCFQIDPEVSYLTQCLRLLNFGKIRWIGQNKSNSGDSIQLGFDAVKKREKLIGEIRKYYTPEILDESAKSDYKEFCIRANEFKGVDSNFYAESFIPLLNKYRPKAPPLTAEQLKRKRRNKVIFFSFLIVSVLLVTLVFILDSKFKKENEVSSKFNLTAKVVYSDSVNNLKLKYDVKYLVAEFKKDDNNTLYAHITLVLVDKNIDDDEAKNIAEFYRGYYQQIAKIRYSNQLILNMWFYTATPSKIYNPTTFSDADIKAEKNLYGNIDYNYDLATFKGTILDGAIK